MNGHPLLSRRLGVDTSTDPAAFMEYANAAKAGCPVSQALAGTQITLDATLAAR